MDAVLRRHLRQPKHVQEEVAYFLVLVFLRVLSGTFLSDDFNCSITIISGPDTKPLDEDLGALQAIASEGNINAVQISRVEIMRQRFFIATSNSPSDAFQRISQSKLSIEFD